MLEIMPVGLVLNELWHRFSKQAAADDNGKATAKIQLQVYAFGASSGGAFVSSIAGPLQSRFGIHVDGFESQIAARLPSEAEEMIEDPNLCKVYITMNRDERTNRAAETGIEKFLSIDILEIIS